MSYRNFHERSIKICSKCKLEKSITKFYKDKNRKNGIHCHCKNCMNKQNRRYHLVHKKQLTQYYKRYNKQYGTIHREQLVRQHKQYRAVNKRLVAKWNKKYNTIHKKKIARYRKRYYTIHKDQIAQYCRQYRTIHKTQIARSNKKWYVNNPDKVLINWHRYRARECNAPGSFTVNDVIHMRKRQNDNCHYCYISLNNRGTVDHRTPLIRGGTNWPNNLCLACKPCNSSKGAKTELEFRQRQVVA